MKEPAVDCKETGFQRQRSITEKVTEAYMEARKNRTLEIIECLKARGFKKASKYVKWLFTKHD